jgi:regulatory protein
VARPAADSQETLGIRIEPDRASSRLDGDYRAAMERAGRLLAIRPRSERELWERLLDAGLEPEAVERAITRLTELGLIDDLAFARGWVAERTARRPVGRASLVWGLVDKGVEREVAESALDELAADEQARATEAAAVLIRRVARKPLAQQGPALWTMLLRRGFSEDVAEAAVKEVLPPDGWD